MRMPTSAFVTTGASASIKMPGSNAGDKAERRRDRYIAASELLSVSCAALGGRRARAAEESHAERLDETGGGERRR